MVEALAVAAPVAVVRVAIVTRVVVAAVQAHPTNRHLSGLAYSLPSQPFAQKYHILKIEFYSINEDNLFDRLSSRVFFSHDKTREA